MSESITLDKAVKFAIRTVNLYKYLTAEKHEYVMSKKLLDVGTDFGLRVKSAQQAISRPDFAAELSVALKRTEQTQYWLDLLHTTEFLSTREHESLTADCRELYRLLTASVKTSKS